MVEMVIPLVLYLSFAEICFEIIDSLVRDLKKCFKQTDSIFIQKLETLLLDSASGIPLNLPKEIIDMYEIDMDLQS